MGQIHMQWGMAGHEASQLIEFFVRNVTEQYISHGEIQSGRAQGPSEWSPDLGQKLMEELSSLSPEPGPSEGQEGTYAFLGLQETQIACLGILEIHKEDRLPYAVLSDLIVSAELRNLGVGKEAMEWLEIALEACGIRWFFLESGLGNSSAHRFFAHMGFQQCSITMAKQIPSVASTNQS